jgi:predicted dehydrogenase|tara:strand:+ start:2456 stop:3472 length:1017 start_codon:yes stop_codon:yes gene_type:complete
MVKKNIVVVGCGPMGLRHTEAIEKSKTLNLIGVSDIDSTKKGYFLEKGISFSRNWKRYIENSDIDGLVISTNGPSHKDLTLEAIKLGVKNILCEKPMATSLDDASKMINLCKKNNVRLAINHSRRWMQSYINLKKLLDKKIIGDIKHLSYQFGGGQLASNGGHLWDLARYLSSSDPKSVMAILDSKTSVNPRGKQYSDPGGYGLIKFTNDCRVFFDMKEDYSNPFFLEIMGSHGRILIDEKSNQWDIFARSKENWNLPIKVRTKLVKIPFKSTKVNMIDASKNAIEELVSRRKISCKGEDGFSSLEVSVAAHESHKSENKFVDLPLNKNQRKIRYSFT